MCDQQISPGQKVHSIQVHRSMTELANRHTRIHSGVQMQLCWLPQLSHVKRSFKQHFIFKPAILHYLHHTCIVPRHISIASDTCTHFILQQYTVQYCTYSITLSKLVLHWRAIHLVIHVVLVNMPHVLCFSIQLFCYLTGNWNKMPWLESNEQSRYKLSIINKEQFRWQRLGYLILLTEKSRFVFE